jgi:hypothetical protein
MANNEEQLRIVCDNNYDNNNASDPPNQAARNFTNFNFKVKSNKIPELFRKKGEDQNLTMDCNRCIDDLTRTNNWSDKVAYNNFANALRCMAWKWLFSMVVMEEITNDQLQLLDFKDLFREKFAIQSNNKLIIEGLSNLAMKLGKTTRNLINRVTDTMVISRAIPKT